MLGRQGTRCPAAQWLLWLLHLNEIGLAHMHSTLRMEGRRGPPRRTVSFNRETYCLIYSLQCSKITSQILFQTELLLCYMVNHWKLLTWDYCCIKIDSFILRIIQFMSWKNMSFLPKCFCKNANEALSLRSRATFESISPFKVNMYPTALPVAKVKSAKFWWTEPLKDKRRHLQIKLFDKITFAVKVQERYWPGWLIYWKPRTQNLSIWSPLIWIWGSQTV